MSIFEKLNTKNMRPHVKSLQGASYIPWADQLGELLKTFPDSTFEVHENEVGDPFTVSSMGIMVKVSVTIEGLTRTINYPVLNNANKSMKIDAYTYQVMDYKQGKPTGRMIDKHVNAATTFDINTSIMRALTKCIALFGQGLYIYRDELMPDVAVVDSSQLQEVVNLIKEKKLTLTWVCEEWGMDKIAMLQADNFEKMINWLNEQGK
jgi:hypothetical protein